MGDNTKIEWAEASVSPIRARNKETGRPGWFCSHVSDGCIHCYSEALNHRLGTGVEYRAQNRDLVDVCLDEKILTLPLNWRRPRRIFWNSMSDTFGEFVSDEWIDRIFAVMALTPQHTHLVLTKRHERMRNYLKRYTGMKPHGVFPGRPGPLPNVWAGVSVEDQRRADERIPVLLDTPAAVRWISAEPLLGAVDLSKPLALERAARADLPDYFRWRADGTLAGINWVVIGGESGAGARPFNIEWARSIIAQCRAAGVPVFMKQLGRLPIGSGFKFSATIRDRKGGDPAEWSKDLRVREYPA